MPNEGSPEEAELAPYHRRDRSLRGRAVARWQGRWWQGLGVAGTRKSRSGRLSRDVSRAGPRSGPRGRVRSARHVLRSSSPGRISYRYRCNTLKRSEMICTLLSSPLTPSHNHSLWYTLAKCTALVTSTLASFHGRWPHGLQGRYSRVVRFVIERTRAPLLAVGHAGGAPGRFALRGRDWAAGSGMVLACLSSRRLWSRGAFAKRARKRYLFR